MTPVPRLASLFSALLASHLLFAGENVWTTNGPPGPVSALAIDPTTLTVYAVARTAPYRDGVFGRSNTAETWGLLAEAPPFGLISTIAVDPFNSNVYASINSGFFGGSVYRSTDNGITWFLVTPSQTNNFWYFAFPANDPAALYAGGSDCYCTGTPCFYQHRCSAAVLKSTDSGMTWSVLGGRLAGGQITSVALSTLGPNRVSAGGDGGIFLSSDAGNHWAAAETHAGDCASVTSLLTDPRNDHVIFAATTWKPAGLFECGGVFRSDDGGRTWAPTSLRSRDVTALLIDPRNPDTLYAGIGGENPIYPDVGVFQSTDGGKTWARVGSELPGVTALVIEPSGRALHAATSAGVFDYEIVPGARPPVIPPRSHSTRTLPARP